ncbi:hypothetical protein ACHAO7_006538 [Fusarium culmorum]
MSNKEIEVLTKGLNTVEKEVETVEVGGMRTKRNAIQRGQPSSTPSSASARKPGDRPLSTPAVPSSTASGRKRPASEASSPSPPPERSKQDISERMKAINNCRPRSSKQLCKGLSEANLQLESRRSLYDNDLLDQHIEQV